MSESQLDEPLSQETFRELWNQLEVPSANVGLENELQIWENEFSGLGLTMEELDNNPLEFPVLPDNPLPYPSSSQAGPATDIPIASPCTVLATAEYPGPHQFQLQFQQSSTAKSVTCTVRISFLSALQYLFLLHVAAVLLFAPGFSFYPETTLTCRVTDSSLKVMGSSPTPVA
ncbi:cellular tumor antigen p53-like [Cetorhinus maximus]